MLPIHGAVSNGAIHNKCGPVEPRWKIPWRRGVGRRAIEPRRRGGGRREKGSDREICSNPVYFVLNFAKKAIFIVFYASPTDGQSTGGWSAVHTSNLSRTTEVADKLDRFFFQ
jgi:hypothetical protein